ncbi:MAG: ParA family partition ATPase [Candidatus Sedimenticola sp. (ex Thyasira tokunagai)]
MNLLRDAVFPLKPCDSLLIFPEGTRTRGVMLGSKTRLPLAFFCKHAIMLESKHDIMQTIAIISQKGGAGKTTMALNMAVASELFGQPAVIVDLDPQASAKAWHDSREDETPIVISAHASRLDDVLSVARENGAGLTIIDTAPHSESDALKAARAADLILIPCRPAVLDLRAIASTKELSDLAKTPAVAVINAAPPRGHLADEAAEAIRGYGLDVAPVTIAQRAAFVHSLTLGKTALEYEPKGKAAHEVKALFMFACNHANMKT